MSITLQNAIVRMEIDPALGGKITSLRDLTSQREWLWTNPYLPQQTPVYGSSFVETLDTGGWDEIFPSVAPCSIDGLNIPDHGDLVFLPWEVTSLSDNHVVMSVRTQFANIHFTREIILDGSSLLVNYQLTNESDITIPWLWCAHPLIATEPGTQIILPHGTPMVVDGGPEFLWPQPPNIPPLDVLPDGSQPFAVKIFTAAHSVNEVTLSSADQSSSLHLTWDTNDNPYLGMWINCKGWSGCGSLPYFNLGLEPTTSPHDSLVDAQISQTNCLIHPSEIRTWSIKITLTHSVA